MERNAAAAADDRVDILYIGISASCEKKQKRIFLIKIAMI